MASNLKRLAISVALAAALWPAAAMAAAIPVTRNVAFKGNFDRYPPLPGSRGYAACWSYVHQDGREYAVIGATSWTLIYNVTDPDNVQFVAEFAGPASTWREMKSYRNWIYVVTEAPGTGIQIIRMTDPEHPVLVGTYTTNFQTSHTVSVDTTRALLICNGTRTWSGNSGFASGMRILSLANPEAPMELSWWPGGAIPVSTTDYVHDSVPVGNRLYASSINAGIHRVIDFTNPALPTEINHWNYPGGFTHNSWPDATGNYVYLTDEVNGQPLKIFDISNLMAPVQVNAITCNPQAIVHNAHVRGNELYLANYTEGIRLLDISDPVHPAEFAWADSWPGASGGFFGVWEVCPFFPSGTVIASDIQTGLYVYRPVRDYGILRVKVVDQATGDPLSGVEVFLTTQGDSLITPADGIVQFAPSPGSHSVMGRKFDYETGLETRMVSVGSRDTVILAITTADLTGTVVEEGTGTPLEDAEVFLDQPVSDFSDAAGAYVVSDVPQGSYRIGVHSPGHIPVLLDPAEIGPTHNQANFRLVPTATWDALEVESGWTVGAPGDDATGGFWERVDPLGTGEPQTTSAVGAGVDASASGRAARSTGGESHNAPDRDSCPWPAGNPSALAGLHQPVRRSGSIVLEHEEPDETACYVPGTVQPEYDRSPPPGTKCFITGQGTDPILLSQADVDGGRTSLTSPVLDLTGMVEPTIGYWRWFYGTEPVNDFLQVLISNDNGANWVLVETVTGIQNRWLERAIRVADFVAPTSQMRVRFVAADLGGNSLVEGAIDDVVTYDAATAPVSVTPGSSANRLAFRTPWPNPAAGRVSLRLEMPRSGPVEVAILDLAGRHVRTLHRGATAAGTLALEWNGADESGHAAPAGLYVVRARAGSERATARFVMVR